MKGHIEKRGDRNWRIKIYLGLDPLGRKKYHYKTVTGTKREAQQVLTEILHEFNQNTFIEPTKLTVAMLFDRWLQDYGQANLALRSMISYKQIVESYIKPRLGSLELTKLSPLHLQQYYSQLLQGSKLGRDGKGLSPTTVHKHHAIIHEALSHALRWGLIARNVADAVEPPRKLKSEMKIWSPEEAAVFLSHIQNHRYYAFYLAAILTGMRLGELLGLRWSDVDLSEGIMSVQQALIKGGPSPVFGNTKTDRSRRQVALPQEVIVALKREKAQQASERLVLGSDYVSSGLVFVRKDGRHIDPTWASFGLFKMLIRQAGVPEIRFHDLRHTHASLMLRKGIHPKIVSERLGHSSIQITLDIYSHVLPDMQKDAAQDTANMLFESKIPKRFP